MPKKHRRNSSSSMTRARSSYSNADADGNLQVFQKSGVLSGAEGKLLDISLACRDLPEGINPVVGLFELEPGAKQLTYRSHSEVRSQESNPTFDTRLSVRCHPGQNQRLKFNVYYTKPGVTKIAEKDLLASAFVLLDDILKNTDSDLVCDLTHGYNPERNELVKSLGSTLLLKARLVETAGPTAEADPQEAFLMMLEGRVFKKYPRKRGKPQRRNLFYQRGESLGRLCWCDVGKRQVSDSRSLWLEDIRGMYEAHQTRGFMAHKLDPSSAQRCFSVISDERELDLEAEDKRTRDAFMLAIHNILTDAGFQQKGREAAPKAVDQSQFRQMGQRASKSAVKVFALARQLPGTKKASDKPSEVLCALFWQNKKQPQWDYSSKTEWVVETHEKGKKVRDADFRIPMKCEHRLNQEQMLQLNVYRGEFTEDSVIGCAVVSYDKLMQVLSEQMGNFVEVKLRHPNDTDVDKSLQAAGAHLLLSVELPSKKGKGKRRKRRGNRAVGLDVNLLDSDSDESKLADSYDDDDEITEAEQMALAKAAMKQLHANAALSARNLSTGATFTKYAYGKRGKPQSRLVHYVASKSKKNLGKLVWSQPGKSRKAESCLPLADITQIYLGKQTEVMLRGSASKAVQEACLSLEYQGRTLDLEAPDRKKRDRWANDLQTLLKAHGKEAQLNAGVEDFDKFLINPDGTVGRQRFLAAQKRRRKRLRKQSQQAAGSLQPSREPSRIGRDEEEGNAGGDGPQLSEAMQKFTDMLNSGADASDIFSSLKELDINKFGNLELFEKGALEKQIREVQEQQARLKAEEQAAAKGSGKSNGGKAHAKTSEKDDDSTTTVTVRGTGGGGDGSGSETESEEESESSQANDSEAAAKRRERQLQAEREREEWRARQKQEAANWQDMETPPTSDSEDDMFAPRQSRQGPSAAAGGGVPGAPPLPLFSGGVPGAPPMAPGIPGAPPMAPGLDIGSGKSARTIKLKQLHWDVLPADAAGPDTDSIWFSLGTENAVEGDLAKLFRASETKKIKKKDTKPKDQELVDAKRSNNVEIALRRFKMSQAHLVDAIMFLDPEVLTDSNTQILMDAAPTAKEKEALANFKGDRDKLSKVAKWFELAATVERLDTRLQCFQYTLRFEHMAQRVEQQLQLISGAGWQMKTSPNLKRVLEVVLSVGNYLNEGTRKGQARGFKLTSLNKLQFTKSTDGKQSLLDFVVDYVVKEEEDGPGGRGGIAGEAPPGFLADCQEVLKAARIDWDDLSDVVKEMKSSLKLIKKELARTDAYRKEDDRFRPCMKEFYSIAKKRLHTIAKTWNATRELGDALLAYYGEVPESMSLSEFFQTFAAFFATFSKAEKIRFEKKERKRRTKHRYKGKIVGSGNSNSTIPGKSTGTAPADKSTDKPADTPTSGDNGKAQESQPVAAAAQEEEEEETKPAAATDALSVMARIRAQRKQGAKKPTLFEA